MLFLLHKNGLSLGEDQRIEDLWNVGLNSYSDQQWEQCIDMLEEALRLFNQYENATFSCLKMCKDEGISFQASIKYKWVSSLLWFFFAESVIQLSSKDKQTIEEYAGDDPFIKQFVLYAARGRCMRECKARILPPKLRNPDTEVIKEFRKRMPYSYLHFAYYQVRVNDDCDILHILI